MKVLYRTVWWKASLNKKYFSYNLMLKLLEKYNYQIISTLAILNYG
ncbi:MAG: hypothetical protein K0R49_72 [Burkholderiales bacterium]|jgi:hypothetical protein|nr:hypothetical protein [Burkholderiales bacterium]